MDSRFDNYTFHLVNMTMYHKVKLFINTNESPFKKYNLVTSDMKHR